MSTTTTLEWATRLGPLWKRLTRAGDPFLTGPMSPYTQLLIFKNKVAGMGGNEPDLKAYLGRQGGKDSALIYLTGLWQAREQDGKLYYRGHMNSSFLTVIRNLVARGQEPTHFVYLAAREPRRLTPHGHSLAVPLEAVG